MAILQFICHRWQFASSLENSHGVIVGSAIVKLVEKYGKDAVPYVAEFVKNVKDVIWE